MGCACAGLAGEGGRVHALVFPHGGTNDEAWAHRAERAEVAIDMPIWDRADRGRYTKGAPRGWTHPCWSLVTAPISCREPMQWDWLWVSEKSEMPVVWAR
jgi:hypothetical protein